jgi:2-C-methyl-D-erythritol 4-phosphate cytidylyltransferase
MKKNLVIVLAGGSGTRVAGTKPKQFLHLCGKPILAHTLEKFHTHPRVTDIFVVSHPQFCGDTVAIVEKLGFLKVRKVLNGGASRQESSRIGVLAASDEYENVLIHDAVRPFVPQTLIDRLLLELETCPAVVSALPPSDTLVTVDKQDCVSAVLDRGVLRAVQTPQAFKLELIQKAHRLAPENHLENAGDDCSLVVSLGLAKVRVILGPPENIKITYPQDLALAEYILEQASSQNFSGGTWKM